MNRTTLTTALTAAALIFTAADAAAQSRAKRKGVSKKAKTLKTATIKAEKFDAAKLNVGSKSVQLSAKELSAISKWTAETQGITPAPLTMTKAKVAADLEVDPSTLAGPVKIGMASGLRRFIPGSGAKIEANLWTPWGIDHQGVIIAGKQDRTSTSYNTLAISIEAPPKRAYHVACTGTGVPVSVGSVPDHNYTLAIYDLGTGGGADTQIAVNETKELKTLVANTGSSPTTLKVIVKAGWRVKLPMDMCTVTEIALP